jgi:hypothetical protein
MIGTVSAEPFSGENLPPSGNSFSIGLRPYFPAKGKGTATQVIGCAVPEMYRKFKTISQAATHSGFLPLRHKLQLPGPLRALIQPALQGILAFAGWPAKQQAHHTEVFVQIGPMNPFAASDELPVIAFLGCTMHQAWVPCERYRDRPSVSEINRQ